MLFRKTAILAFVCITGANPVHHPQHTELSHGGPPMANRFNYELSTTPTISTTAHAAPMISHTARPHRSQHIEMNLHYLGGPRLPTNYNLIPLEDTPTTHIESHPLIAKAVEKRGFISSSFGTLLTAALLFSASDSHSDSHQHHHSTHKFCNLNTLQTNWISFYAENNGKLMPVLNNTIANTTATTTNGTSPNSNITRTPHRTPENLTTLFIHTPWLTTHATRLRHALYSPEIRSLAPTTITFAPISSHPFLPDLCSRHKEGREGENGNGKVGEGGDGVEVGDIEVGEGLQRLELVHVRGGNAGEVEEVAELPPPYMYEESPGYEEMAGMR